MLAITKRQKQLLDFLIRFSNKRGYSPSYKEIMDELGLSSFSSVHKLVHRLKKQGAISVDYGGKRSIVVTSVPENVGDRVLFDTNERLRECLADLLNFVLRGTTTPDEYRSLIERCKAALSETDLPACVEKTEIKKKRDVKDRFLSKVNKNGPFPKYPGLGRCWLWMGSKKKAGYGNFLFCGRVSLAHKVSLLIHGRSAAIEGKECDHLCGNTSCVNPDHIEIVTHAENMARARAARFNQAVSA